MPYCSFLAATASFISFSFSITCPAFFRVASLFSWACITFNIRVNKNKSYTKQFKDIVSNYGLDLDGDWNKESLPHQGRHPNAYHDYILDNMQKFDRIANGDKEKFLELFDKMKQNIIKNPDMLYKDYWKK